MNMLLSFTALFSKIVAISSCSLISTLDSYQPVRPKAVMDAAKKIRTK
ncbi:MAG: hypothetical protein J6O41_04615 [Clostridia bacterium]|nr:hypothetical protein [Clostridia bacterium]